MKVIIEEVKTYLVKTESGVEVGKFDHYGDWCGMTQLKSNNPELGSIVVDSTETFGEAVFSELFGKKAKLVDVVKASPSLAHLLLSGEKDENS